jgi:hypothetical protein
MGKPKIVVVCKMVDELFECTLDKCEEYKKCWNEDSRHKIEQALKKEDK